MYPQLRDRVPAGAEGDGWPQPLAKYDTSKADKVFGTGWWLSWWETVDGVVKDILEKGEANIGY
jgi:hypothetical protein